MHNLFEHLIANEFFLLARDDHNGHPYLGPAIEATALAAALLGELLIDRLSVIHQGLVYDQSHTLDSRPQSDQLRIRGDPALHTGMHFIAGQRQPPPVTALIEFLADKVHQPIVDRLVSAGEIEVKRTLRGVRYVPASLFAWGRPRTRLWGAATYDGRYAPMKPTEQVRLLAGLVLATGLESRVTPLVSTVEVKEGLAGLTDGLADDLQIVVGSVVQTVRRIVTRR